MSASNPNPSSLPTDAPWNTPWPASELENVPACPVCGSAERTILHDGLIDNVFFVAPGEWTLWKCGNCGSAYLDPRPNRETICLAYANYSTHIEAATRKDYAALSPFRKLGRHLVNGYTNWRYSTHAQPSSSFGVLVAFTMPKFKRLWDRRYRHIPKLPKKGGQLLDVGCGNGSFLSLARTCGWDVYGLDPDPKAAANADRDGLTVYVGGVEHFEGQSELFDVITLSHVIEHVHDPIKLLMACHRLLKPGGQIWVETPNIDSFGHSRFQQYWRGLETPRHLVLFNRHSLRQALATVGFRELRDLPNPSPCASMFAASYAMKNGQSPHQAIVVPKHLKWYAAVAGYLGVLLPARREFLTMSAYRRQK